MVSVEDVNKCSLLLLSLSFYLLFIVELIKSKQIYLS